MTEYAGPPRRTKIVATLGTASEHEQVLRAMLEAGVDVVRLNLSHGTHAQHAANARRARDLSAAMGRPLALLLDLQGPKIRTGSLQRGEPVVLADNASFTITTEQAEGTAARVSTTFQSLPEDAKPGNRILLDDGHIELHIDKIQGRDVQCSVVHGGMLGEHKGINLPGVAVSAPALTSKDAEDLRFGLDLGVDVVALSFVRRASDATPVREIIRTAGKWTPIIAKLEKPEAMEHLTSILAAFDGVMVARGDLGVELPPERVPMLQKQIIARARRQGKLVITATQMLESMTQNPRPTRAEASDVANAICDGTDALMLSAETATGKYTAESVAMMDRIARQTEAGIPQATVYQRNQPSYAHAVTHAGCSLAQEVRAAALVVFTHSGTSGHLVSAWRSAVPTYAYTPEATTYRNLAMWWGIEPVLMPFQGTTDTMLPLVTHDLIARGAVRSGDVVIFIGSAPLLVRGRTNFIKLQTVR